ncbi:heterokaryon incompatibility, partial [Cryphonectria parasitica EP155]
FEAISYVWGTDLQDQCILVNNNFLTITRNLRGALEQVRLPDRPRVLWADSICIDQQNKREKGHQVGLMARIYSLSICTLICLG